MRYLDFDRLDALDPVAFQSRKPFPWMNPQGLLTDEGYKRLLETLPDVSLFQASFGLRRRNRQSPHDRFILEYDERLDTAEPWHAFIDELRGEAYGRFLRRMFGRGWLRLKFDWHYTPKGCSVSPHCDATRKVGTHLFYLNTVENWDPAWGGQTLVLDDGGRFKSRSAPAFEDFESAVAAEELGNRSLLFRRQRNSWHGVRELCCPEGKLRKIFRVVANDGLKFFTWGA